VHGRQSARLEFADRSRGVRPRGGLRLAEKLTANAKQPDLPKESSDMALGGSIITVCFRGTPTAKLRESMQQVMQNNCAVFRTGEVLNEART